MGKLPGCLNAYSRVRPGLEVTWGQPAATFLGPTWLSLHRAGGPVPHPSFFPPYSPGRDLASNCSGEGPPPTLSCGAGGLAKGDMGSGRAAGWWAASCQKPCRGAVPWVKSPPPVLGKSWQTFSLGEFVAGDPQGGEREALNDCTWHHSVPSIS